MPNDRCRLQKLQRERVIYCHILGYITMYYCTLPYIIIYYHVLSHIILYYQILSFIIIYYHILSYIIIYYHIYYHILSYTWCARARFNCARRAKRARAHRMSARTRERAQLKRARAHQLWATCAAEYARRHMVPTFDAHVRALMANVCAKRARVHRMCARARTYLILPYIILYYHV